MSRSHHWRWNPSKMAENPASPEQPHPPAPPIVNSKSDAMLPSVDDADSLESDDENEISTHSKSFTSSLSTRSREGGCFEREVGSTKRNDSLAESRIGRDRDSDKIR